MPVWRHSKNWRRKRLGHSALSYHHHHTAVSMARADGSVVACENLNNDATIRTLPCAARDSKTYVVVQLLRARVALKMEFEISSRDKRGFQLSIFMFYFYYVSTSSATTVVVQSRCDSCGCRPKLVHPRQHWQWHLFGKIGCVDRNLHW